MIRAHGVLRFVGSAYMRIFVKFTILGPFFRGRLICEYIRYFKVFDFIVAKKVFFKTGKKSFFDFSFISVIEFSN